MSEKIKILEIKRDGNQEVQSNGDGKKNFTPVDDLWFMDDTKTNTETFKTDELGKTIENVEIKDDQISIIKNANANFFVSPSEKSSVQSVVRNLPKSINVIENDNVEDSALPKEILKLRKVDFAHEQNAKDKVLEKLSIKLESEASASAAKRAKSSTKALKKSKIVDFDDTTTEDMFATLPEEKLKMKVEDSSTTIPNLGGIISNPASQSRQAASSNLNATQPEKKAEPVMAPQTQTSTSDNSSDSTDFFDVDVHDITAVLKQTSKQNIKTMEDKKIARNIHIPVVNNTDYTIANTINDINKPITNSSTQKLRMDNELNDTTMLVNNLLTEMNKVNQKNGEIKNPNFDEFYDWFKSSKESKKLQKIAKKENKKMLKKKV